MSTSRFALALSTLSLLAPLAVTSTAHAEDTLDVSCSDVCNDYYDASGAYDFVDCCTPGGDPDLTGDVDKKLSALESVWVSISCPDGSYATGKTTSGGATCYDLVCYWEDGGKWDCGFSCTNWHTDDKWVHIDSVGCAYNDENE